MITRRHLAAMLGFGFVAAWIGFGFGDAVLCILGAAIFYAAVSFLEGDLDLIELQSRFGGGDLQGRFASRGSAGPRASSPRPRSGPRVH